MNPLTKKIVFLSHSGNVGKSIMANKLLEFMKPETPLFEITPIKRNTPNSFQEIGFGYPGNDTILNVLVEMVLYDSIIIDISAGSMEKFIHYMSQFNWEDIGVDFDYFVIPVLPNSQKIAIDTIETIKFLNKFGVPSEKIKVILITNENDQIDNLNPMESFQDILNILSFSGNFSLYSFNPDSAEHSFQSIFRLSDLGSNGTEK